MPFDEIRLPGFPNNTSMINIEKSDGPIIIDMKIVLNPQVPITEEKVQEGIAQLSLIASQILPVVMVVGHCSGFDCQCDQCRGK